MLTQDEVLAAAKCALRYPARASATYFYGHRIAAVADAAEALARGKVRAEHG